MPLARSRTHPVLSPPYDSANSVRRRGEKEGRGEEEGGREGGGGKEGEERRKRKRKRKRMMRSRTEGGGEYLQDAVREFTIVKPSLLRCWSVECLSMMYTHYILPPSLHTGSMPQPPAPSSQKPQLQTVPSPPPSLPPSLPLHFHIITVS